MRSMPSIGEASAVMTPLDVVLSILVLLAVVIAGLLPHALRRGADDDRLTEARVRDLAAPAPAGPTRTRLGDRALRSFAAAAEMLLPGDEERRTQLQNRLVQAGYSGPYAPAV